MNNLLTKTDIAEGGIILAGLSVSLQDIQSILSIILLCVDVVWLIFKFIYKAYKKVKNGEDLDVLGKPSDVFNKEGDK